MNLSVIIPVFNEEENVPILYSSLKKVLNKLRKSYEIIFIDDGSRDKTFDRLRNIQKKDRKVRIIKFRKNFGQTAALSAGFRYSGGEIIITIDGDLQNDPNDITGIIQKMNEGYDVVSGWRYKRRDPFFKKIFSKFSNWIARKLTGVNLHDFGCSLKGYRRYVVRDLDLFGEMHRFIPAIVAVKGFSVSEIVVKHNERRYGKTKYGSGRLIKGLLDLVYIKFWSDYSTRPLHLFGLFGLVLLFFGGLIAFYKVFIQLLLLRMPLDIGPLLLLSVLLIVTGVQFIVFGFLAEILVRTYYNKERETFSIEKIIG
jgi:glycosyltransferase involved in cell wall biosynthesis